MRSPNDYEKQQALNEQMERSALAITAKIGDVLEFSDGTTLILKKKPKGGATQVVLVLLMPEEIRVYRPSKGQT